MKNVVILHLESISRQRLAAFEPVLPHTMRLLREALAFENHYASATSTVMVLGYLFHGNDFEFDTATEFDGLAPERNNPHLFSVLREHGYDAQMICLNGHQHVRPLRLRSWAGGLPPAWATTDFPALISRFDELTDAPPFAIYVWDLITHIEHSLALAPYSHGLADQIQRACAVADEAVGAMRAILERKGLLDSTTIVLFGDHGDDMWTHGFKGGMIHGTEPYTDIIWTPLAIRDADLGPGTADHPARTIDIAPTCLGLLGIDAEYAFPHSGIDLLRGAADLAYSQNYTANQPDNPTLGISKAYSVTDRNYTMLASSRGLELYAHRLDPGNHANLLHFFTLDAAGNPVLDARPGAAAHFLAGWRDNRRAVECLVDDFHRLRSALVARVEAKRAYIVERGVEPRHALGRACLDVINREGREAFFRRATGAVRTAIPALDFSFKLR